jgi:hypothetical protein
LETLSEESDDEPAPLSESKQKAAAILFDDVRPQVNNVKRP